MSQSHVKYTDSCGRFLKCWGLSYQLSFKKDILFVGVYLEYIAKKYRVSPIANIKKNRMALKCYKTTDAHFCQEPYLVLMNDLTTGTRTAKVPE